MLSLSGKSVNSNYSIMEKKHLETIYSALKGTGVNEIKLETENFKFEMLTNDNTTNTPRVKPNVVDKNIKNIPVVLNDIESEEISGIDIYSQHIGFFTRFDPKTKKQCVKLRTPIKKGDVVGFVSSLHVAYPIVSDKHGKIIHFLVEEGQPIEYKQPVIRLETIDEK